MINEIAAVIADALHIAALLYLLFRSARLLRGERRTLPLAFFVFAIVSLLLSDCYWLTYNLLRPGTRMPIAANEIGEAAAILLLTSALNGALADVFVDTRREAFFTGLFCVASIALWIAWSGEWLQDILGGIAYAWFYLSAVRGLKSTEALSQREWIVLGLDAGLLIIAQTAMFFVQSPWHGALDLFSYALMLMGCALFFLRMRREKRGEARPKTLMALSFASLAWAMSSMFMSEEPWYFLFYLCSIVCWLLIGRSIRREVETA